MKNPKKSRKKNPTDSRAGRVESSARPPLSGVTDEPNGETPIASLRPDKGRAVVGAGQPTLQPERQPGGDERSVDGSTPSAPNIPQLGPGVYEKVDSAIYFAQNSISRSDLVDPSGTSQTPWTPAKFKFFKDRPDMRKKPTKPQIIGDAFHTKILEPELFATRYAISPFESFRTKNSQIWADEQSAAGLKILTKEQVDMIDLMEIRAREHSQFANVFRRAGSRKEVTIITQHPQTGLMLRARYDMLVPGNALVDIKSCLDASPEGFGKQVWSMEYGAQASFYRTVYNLAATSGDRKEEFIFFAFEKEAPYLASFFVTPHVLMEYWDKVISARLYMIASSMKTNKWPGYSEEIEEFELPRYAISEIEKVTE
jgi:hypothetical protein